MVAAVRRGDSKRSVARQYGVALSTVQLWVDRAAGKRLDRVDWSDRPSGPSVSPRRTSREKEEVVLQIRQELKETSDLGEFGAAAIREEWLARNLPDVPAVRTIGYILERRGALDGQQRIRRPAPPSGWYLPEVANQHAEIDLWDVIEGLVIKGGPQVEVLTVLSLHGALSGAWPTTRITAKAVREALLEHWRESGLPDYVQFDNATVFQGPHQHRDAIGSVIRLCLSLQVTPIFVPPREPGFQAAIESFNGRWQAKVRMRFHHESVPSLQAQSAKYIAAHRGRTAQRRDTTPGRRCFPKRWKLNLQAQPQGRIIFLRRTTGAGQVSLLGHALEVDRKWPNRLVRCEVRFNEQVIRFYALRRRAPTDQPLLKEVPYVFPNKRFRE